MSSRNALNGIATPPGSLAELKLKAKESILAKKAQNIRSSSHDTAVQINGADSTTSLKVDMPAQNENSRTRVEASQHDPLRSDEGFIDATRSTVDLLTAENSHNHAAGPSKISSPHAMISSNLVPPRNKKSGGVKASSVELEDLLAEGRAAAEKRSAIAPESTGFRGSPDSRTEATLAESGVQPDQTATGSTVTRFADQRISSKDTPQVWETSAKEQNGNDARNEHHSAEPLTTQNPGNSNPEKISKDANPNSSKLQADRDIDMSDAPKPEEVGRQIQQVQLNKPGGSQEQKVTHEVTVAGDPYTVDDIEEWLVMTGFYDDAYRQKVLARRRRMKAIEEERLQLLLEEQADQDQRSQLVRSHSVLAVHPAPVSPFLARTSSVLPMPAAPTGSSATKDLGLRIKDSALKNENHTGTAKPTETVVEVGSLKRRNSPSNTKEEEGQTRKMMRTESNDQQTTPMRRVNDQTSASSPTAHQQSPQARAERFIEEPNPSHLRREGDLSANTVTKRKYDQWVPDKPAMHEDHRRNSHDSRNVRSFDSDRRTNRPAFNSGPRYSDYQSSDQRPTRYAGQDRFRKDPIDDTSPTKSGTNLRVKNVRYFLIKSWNYENIETAQRECTWCTQTKNEDLFVDAFRNSTHVILIFSANNSHAFQGYARMQGLPGEPGVADPTWRKYLHWPTTKPFKIKWITKGDSSYRVAGNLRNPLNDDSMVFVGRDGQEIPDHIGLELCEALDQDAKYRGNRRDY